MGIKACCAAHPSAATDAAISCYWDQCGDLQSSEDLQSSARQCDGAIFKPGCECFSTKCDAASCLGDANCAQAFQCAAGTCGTATSSDPDCIKACGSAYPGAATESAISCFFDQCGDVAASEQTV